MRKNLLLIVAVLIASIANLNAQTPSGSINPSGLPSSVRLDETANFSVNYSSNVPCSMNIAIFQTNTDGSVNWGAWKAGTTIPGLAANNGTVNVSFDIPISFNLSEDLPTGVSYVWCLALKADGGNEFTWSNTGNNFTVIEADHLINKVVFTGTPTAAFCGEEVTVNFKYNTAQQSNIKITLCVNEEWTNLGDIAEAYIIDAPATTTKAVNASVKLKVPINAAISSALAKGSYKFEITIFKDGWSWINAFRSPTVTISKPIANLSLLNAPTAIVPGRTVNFKINYSSSIPCELYVGLNKSTKKRSGDIDVTTIPLPAATNSDYEFSVTVPDLVTGDYNWLFEILYTGTTTAITTLTSGNVTCEVGNDEILFSNEPERNLILGKSYKTAFAYTLSTKRDVRISLKIYDNSGNYISTVSSQLLNDELATSTTPIENSFSFAIADNLTLATELALINQKYVWEAEILDDTDNTVVIKSVKSDCWVVAEPAAVPVSPIGIIVVVLLFGVIATVKFKYF